MITPESNLDNRWVFTGVTNKHEGIFTGTGMILKQLHHRKAPLPMGDDSGRLHPWSPLHDSQAAQQIPGTSLQLGCSESPPEQFTTSMALGSGYVLQASALPDWWSLFISRLSGASFLPSGANVSICPAIAFQDCCKCGRFSVEQEINSDAWAFPVPFEASLQFMFFPQLCLHICLMIFIWKPSHFCPFFLVKFHRECQPI